MSNEDKTVFKKEDNFPGNTRKDRLEKKDDPPKIEKIADGKEKKKDGGFFAAAVKDVGLYVLNEVLVPAVKNTISEIVTSGINMLLFNGDNVAQSRRQNTRPKVSYNNIYSNGYSRSMTNYSLRERRSDRTMDIEFSDPRDANAVLDRMYELLDRYGHVTVSDLYQLVGIDTNYTDKKWGWRDLSDASVKRGGNNLYILCLPDSEAI